jgi:hypothetical protein
MTGDKDAQSNDDLSFALGKEQLHRLLIEQFYEDSVDRYGTDSEQARMLARLRSQVGLDWSPPKTAN